MAWAVSRIPLLCLLSLSFGYAQNPVVGSKKFVESYVLAEIAKASAKQQGLEVDHRQGIGGTILLWQALRQGEIAAYPDYTGTIKEEILKSKAEMSLAQMRAELQKIGIGVTESLGFNDGYGLAVRKETAERYSLKRISDLKAHPQLKAGFTLEWLERQDGWRRLSERYGLKFDSVQGLEHAIAYQALKDGQIDLKEVYTTDAEIQEMGLVVLEDDLNYFPLYLGVFLYRLDSPEPLIKALKSLEGTINDAQMINMNLEAKRLGDPAKAAAIYFGQKTKVRTSHWGDVPARGIEHLRLTLLSMLLAIVVGLPLGIWAAKPGAFGSAIFAMTGVVQTIPSLALLALLAPWLGINERTAIAALFLYSLLPIVRSTAAGLQSIPLPLRESAEALGLKPFERLRLVYLPMASRSILAGVKTSAVINVGTATLAALVGAGGFGQPILIGLTLNNPEMILTGAIPAAALALIVQTLFDAADRLFIPRGLRLQAAAR